MGQEIAIAPFAFWKCAKKFQDSFPKINRQRQDRAELDHNRVHLPEAVVQIQLEERFDDAEMSSRAHWQELGQTFDNPKQDRQYKIVHNISAFSCFRFPFPVSAFISASQRLSFSRNR